jgi:hypothetical protein
VFDVRSVENAAHAYRCNSLMWFDPMCRSATARGSKRSRTATAQCRLPRRCRTNFFGFTCVVAAHGEEVAAPDKRRSHGWNNSLNDPSADVSHGAPQLRSRLYQGPMTLKMLCGPIVHIRTM